MNKSLAAIFLWMLMSVPAHSANTAPASDASIREMLELTNARQLVDGMKGQITALMNTAVHDALFTQDEIDGAIKFYKSAAGKAYVNKQPLVMQNIMQEMQSFMKPVHEKIMAIQRESIQQLKDLQDKSKN